MAPASPARAATVPGGRPADPLVSRAGLRRSRMALGLGAHFGASDRARLLLSWVVHSMTRLRPESGSPASSALSHAPIGACDKGAHVAAEGSWLAKSPVRAWVVAWVMVA